MAQQQDVDRVVAAYENAKESIYYADSIILEPTQISGDNYKMVWTAQYPNE